MKRITRSMMVDAYRFANDHAATSSDGPDDKRTSGERELDAICDYLNKELAKP